MNDTDDRRIAVLIDADNVSSKYIKYIFDEISNHGTPTYKRIYADWTKPRFGAWKDVLLDYSISPIQQYSYTVGKNATDSALIIDAMDILYSHNVDGFCIVSSDSDFTRLAARLREAGMYVMGMGEKKTPKPFISACEKFKYLEVLSSPPEEQVPAHAADGKTADKNGVPKVLKGEMAGTEEITQQVTSIINESSDEEGWTNLSEVGDKLNRRYPDFDTRNYGFSKLSTFILSLKQFEIQTRKTPNRNDLVVRIICAPGQTQSQGQAPAAV